MNSVKWIVPLLVMVTSSLPVYLSAQESKQITQVNVSTVVVREENLSSWVLAEGIAQGIRREYLNFEKGGRVTLISFDEQGKTLREGSMVKGPKGEEQFGQLIASIDERADKERLKQTRASLSAGEQRVIQADSNLIRARNSLNLASDEFRRIQSIFNKKLIPQKQFDIAKTELLNAEEMQKTALAELAAAKSARDANLASLNQAKVELEKTSIYAPFDGVLRTVNLRQGDYFSGPGQSLNEKEKEATSAVVIVDNSQYEVTLNVPAYRAGELAEGQTVYLSGSGYEIQRSVESNFTQGSVATGVIFSVSPGISLDKRSVRIKVHTRTGAENLVDGMYVNAWIRTEQKNGVIAVPFDGVIMRDNKPFVYVVKQGRAWLQAITLGVMSSNIVEVTSGLQKGDVIVTTGIHMLVNGTHVNLVEGL